MNTAMRRLVTLVVLAAGLLLGTGPVMQGTAQDEPYSGSVDITIGTRASTVARVMVQVPVTVTCTLPSVPWETGPVSIWAAMHVEVTQASGRSVVTGERDLYQLEALCDGTPHEIVVEVFGNGTFHGGQAVVNAFMDVSFVSWDPQYIELGAHDATGNQVIRIGG